MHKTLYKIRRDVGELLSLGEHLFTPTFTSCCSLPILGLLVCLSPIKSSQFLLPTMPCLRRLIDSSQRNLPKSTQLHRRHPLHRHHSWQYELWNHSASDMSMPGSLGCNLRQPSVKCSAWGMTMRSVVTFVKWSITEHTFEIPHKRFAHLVVLYIKLGSYRNKLFWPAGFNLHELDFKVRLARDVNSQVVYSLIPSHRTPFLLQPHSFGFLKFWDWGLWTTSAGRHGIQQGGWLPWDELEGWEGWKGSATIVEMRRIGWMIMVMRVNWIGLGVRIASEFAASIYVLGAELLSTLMSTIDSDIGTDIQPLTTTFGWTQAYAGTTGCTGQSQAGSGN